jgi:molybdate transport system substrate-binding protein
MSKSPLIVAVALALLLSACGGVAFQSSASPAADPVQGSLTVLAAASLTDAFNKVGAQLRARHPQLELRYSYAGSQTLVTQIQQGAPADIFASADQANMQKVVAGGLAEGQARVFARNRLQIVVPRGNPKQVRSLADLAGSGLKVDLCAPAVPCGSYAGSALGKANVRVTPVSQEDNVKAVVTRVSLGEADAGIVYATDVKAGGGKVEGVDIPDSENVVAAYPLVRLKAATNGAAADAFIGFVTGAEGQKTLAGYGFLPPS